MADFAPVWKEECMYCFRTPNSEKGLYINANPFPKTGTYDGVCINHVELMMNSRFQQSSLDNAATLIHFTRVPAATSSDSNDKPQPVEAERQQKRLAIGVEGGFKTDEGEINLDEVWGAVKWPDLTTEIPIDRCDEDIRSLIGKMKAAADAFRVAQVSNSSKAWDGEMLFQTKEVDIPQIKDPKTIPRSGWKCQISDCQIKDNLWLNLSDGTILCGRKNFDGSGGNNHAVEHYENSGKKFPLAVKLGTITPQGAYVYSYSEDDMVIDPNLAVHLAHFGINMREMEKTTKTMAELDIELNEQFQSRAIMEADSQLEALHGPGYTGIINLGSSCYMNSVLQTLSQSPSIRRRYVSQVDQLRQAVGDNGNGDNNLHPSENFNFQMGKIFAAMESGDFSPIPPKETADPCKKIDFQSRDGIRPALFKDLVGRGHREFSTARQQDAEEYLRYLFEKINDQNRDDREKNPMMDFMFNTEDRYEDLSVKQVRYSNRNETILSVPIPPSLIENQEAFFEFQKRAKEAKAAKQTIPDDEIVLAKVSLFRCIERFLSSEEINDGKAMRKTSFATFPDLLYVHVGRFTVDQDGITPMKMEASVDVREIMDLEQFRGKGIAPGEVPIPDDVPQGPAGGVWTKPSLNQEFIAQLIAMGFSKVASEKAVYETRSKNSGEAAIEWMMNKMGDEDVNIPHPDLVPPRASSTIDENVLENLTGLGFTRLQSLYAYSKLVKSGEAADVNALAEWLFMGNAESMPDSDTEKYLMDKISGRGADEQTSFSSQTVRDGPGKYRLIGFISHMGSSASCGHYIAHLRKGERWVVFNDEKVAESKAPRIDLAYIYLFQRI